MKDIITENLLFVVPAIVMGIVVGVMVTPRFIFTSLKDNWGKMPDDIDKTYITIIKIGGISFFPLWLITTLIFTILAIGANESGLMTYVFYPFLDLLPLCVCLMVLYMVGIRYDLSGMSSLVRLLTIIVVAAVTPLFGFSLSGFYEALGIHAMPMWIDYVLTILVTAYIIEMVKLLDGMNGLASGTLVITLALLLVLNMTHRYAFPLLPCGGALGIVVPYWLLKMFSKEHRKVIMGNAGAYVMGFVLACAFFTSFSYQSAHGSKVFFVVAFSILMMPAFDTLRVIGSRARDGRSIIMPDRNQINFKLLRTGIPNGGIFPTYIALIVFFAMSSLVLLYVGTPAAVVMAMEVVMWVLAEFVMNYFIRGREKRTHQKEWNRVYGREAWDAKVPYAQIETKQILFGTLGLSQRFIDGDEQAFISDRMSRGERFLKRLADLVVSGLCLIIFSPLFLLCYILIKIDDGKEVIFCQERIGRFGRPFEIYKFRTMRVDAEEGGPQLSHASGEDDPRLTKIGRFLRAHHLDELPQLWNVFRGDMTLIGYRPERKFYIDQIMEHDPRYAFLYQIRPGVTSYATLYNGYTDTMEKMLRRLELDLYYLAHRSWWFDTKILFLTFASIVFGKKF